MTRRLIPYLIAGLTAAALKYHYSTAASDDLRWILAPTAALVNSVTGAGFHFEQGAGFLAADKSLIIAPACAGINFLLICFCMLVFGYLHHFRSKMAKGTWLLTSGLLAYLVTVVVNGARISLSAASFNSQPTASFFSSESLHRLEGIGIYFLALHLLHYFAEIFFNWFSRRSWRGSALQRERVVSKYLNLLLPLFWYLLVTLGIPLLRLSYRGSAPRFAEHAVFVLIIPVAILLALLLLKYVWRLLAPRLALLRSS